MKAEIAGGAGPYEAAAIIAAVQVILAEEEARARRPTTTSRWRVELEEFTIGGWGVTGGTSPSGAEPSG